jgi:hypothetical protein
LTLGLVQVAFKEYNGETDSTFGDKAYSIQLNTNGFNGNNGDEGWVQFVYQDFCGYGYQFVGEQKCESKTGFCIWNIDLTVAGKTNNNQGYNPTCVSVGPVDLSSTYSAVIYGYTAPGQKLVSYLFLPGSSFGLTAVVAPDVYGLAGNWYQVSGGVMGAGGGSQAQFGKNPTIEQTNIEADSCPRPSEFDACTSPQIAAISYQDGSTGESNDLQQFHPSLTSYYSGSHWWLSSTYGSSQFVNYDSTFGWGGQMKFMVTVNPGAGLMYAGGYNPTYITPNVTVTSLNGVQTAPLTMSVRGLNQVGTEDLSGKTCKFSYPLQPGSTCSFLLGIRPNPKAASATYQLTIWAGTGHAQYVLGILPNAIPSPVIVSPPDGASFNVNQAVPLMGFAPTTSPEQLSGWTPCNQMQFQALSRDTGTTLQATTPTQDQSYQDTGYCNAQMTFTEPGRILIRLEASNAQGAKGSAQITITINSPRVEPPHTQPPQTQTPFTFKLTANPSRSVITEGGSPDKITISIILTSGSPQPVELSVSGLPNHATYIFSSKSVTPTSTVTLTITAPYGTPTSTQPVTVTITGTGGGYTASTTIQLSVQTLG